MELLMCECLVARRQFFCSRKYDFIEGEDSSKKVNKIELSFAETCWKSVYLGLDVAVLEKRTLNASSSRHVRRPDF